MTVALKRYKASGFTLLDEIGPGGLRSYPVATTVKIEAGNAVHDNGSGYATDATTALAASFLGIADAEADNTSGEDGAINVLVIPPLPHYRFIVPCAADNVMAQTDIGTMIDLEAAGTVDNSDATIAGGPGFFVDAIDVSTEAIAANTYGYAIGHFAYAA